MSRFFALLVLWTQTINGAKHIERDKVLGPRMNKLKAAAFSPSASIADTVADALPGDYGDMTEERIYKACEFSDSDEFDVDEDMIIASAIEHNVRHRVMRFLAYISYFRHQRFQKFPLNFHCTEAEIQKSIATLNPISREFSFVDVRRMYNIINKESVEINNDSQSISAMAYRYKLVGECIDPHPVLSLCALGVQVHCTEALHAWPLWQPFCCVMTTRFWYVAFTGEPFLNGENNQIDPNIKAKLNSSTLTMETMHILKGLPYPKLLMMMQRESTRRVKTIFLDGIQSLTENVGVHFFSYAAHSLVRGHEELNSHVCFHHAF